MFKLATFKTKSFWAGLALIATGIGQIVAGDIPGGINTLAAGIVAIVLRDAISKGFVK